MYLLYNCIIMVIIAALFFVIAAIIIISFLLLLIVVNEVVGCLLFYYLIWSYKGNENNLLANFETNFLVIYFNNFGFENIWHRIINLYVTVYIRLVIIINIVHPNDLHTSWHNLKLTRTKLRIDEIKFNGYRFFKFTEHSLKSYMIYSYFINKFVFTTTCFATCIGRGRIRKFIRITKN